MTLINWKIMINFIRDFGMEEIPQTVFYRKIHETHSEWTVEQIARCLRFLREANYIEIGPRFEIIPKSIPEVEKEVDLLDEFDNQMIGKVVGKEMHCPVCHSPNVKKIRFKMMKCNSCGFMGIKYRFENNS